MPAIENKTNNQLKNKEEYDRPLLQRINQRRT